MPFNDNTFCFFLFYFKNIYYIKKNNHYQSDATVPVAASNSKILKCPNMP